MHQEISLKELYENAEFINNFVIVKDFDNEQLLKMAIELKRNLPNVEEIYYLNGGDSINYPSFKSIKINPRFIIVNNDIRFKNDGLIFPQKNPIILIFENFDSLEKDDQDKFLLGLCNPEPKEPDIFKSHLHNKSIVILGVSKECPPLNISYKLFKRVIIS